jgi:hypothetical protein
MATVDLIKITAAAIMLLLGITLLVFRGTGRSAAIEPAPDLAWFYDLETGELFADKAAALPPIDAPSGANNGVGAVVYACGSCDEDEQRIGYVQQYSDEGRRAMAQLQQLRDAEADIPVQLNETLDRERYVALPPASGSPPQWASLASPQGQQIASQYMTACGEGTQPRLCPPSP